MSKFAHLHTHTCMSPDGLTSPSALPKVVKEAGQDIVAITDHNTAAGYIEFFNACKIEEVKPIFGNEFYFDYFQDGEKLFHITILARNKIGYENIIKLNNASHRNIIAKRNGKFPRTTAEMFAEYNEGLIALTGCPASVMHETDIFEAKSYVEQLINIFGVNNTFVEVMFTMDNERILQRCVDIVNFFPTLKAVITNDVHFSYKFEAEIHPLTVMAKKGFNYESSDLYVKTYEEMYELVLRELDNDSSATNELFANTIELAESVESFEIFEQPTLPSIPENGKEVLHQYLVEQLQQDIILQDPSLKTQLRERFNLEWKVVNEMNLIDYFYIIFDIKNYAKEKNIVLRLRGSGAGCYLLYLMHISPVHPIIFPLRFDRFLNYERQDYPDVDMDIEPNRRNELFKYVEDRWGMIAVSTFMEYSHKSVIHDICRVLAKEHDIRIPKDLETDACDFGEDSEAFKKLLEYDYRVPLMYNSMIDTVRHRGKHAAAVATPVTICPIEAWGEEPALAWAESGAGRKELSSAGLVKIDMLGVDALNVVAKLADLTNDIFSLDKLTPNVFALFKNKKLPGIFQFKSGASIRIAEMVEPETLDDIAAIVALNRPGPLDAGTAWKYGEWKKNPRKLDERLDKYLNRTYGVIVFQEQVMDIYSEITGEGAAGANDARKILCPKSLKVIADPKWQKENEKLRKKIFTKGQKRGFSNELLEQVWHEISTHARYSFNAAHAYTYAYLALEEAYYLANYPVEYFFCLISDEDLTKDGKQKIQEYLYEAAEHGVEIVRPHVNVSTNQFVLDDKKIYLPLTIFNNLGDNRALSIIKEREINGKFSTISDFVNRVPKKDCNKAVKLNLYLGGAFNGLTTESFRDDVNILGIDYSDSYSDMSQFDKDYFTMKLFILNDSLMRRIKKFSAMDSVRFGFVSEIENGFTKSGKPNVTYRLFPSNLFRVFENQIPTDIEVGMLVGAEVNEFGYLLSPTSYQIVKT